MRSKPERAVAAKLETTRRPGARLTPPASCGARWGLGMIGQALTESRVFFFKETHRSDGPRHLNGRVGAFGDARRQNGADGRRERCVTDLG